MFIEKIIAIVFPLWEKVRSFLPSSASLPEQAQAVIQEVQEAESERMRKIREKVEMIERETADLKAKDSVDVANDIIGGL